MKKLIIFLLILFAVESSAQKPGYTLINSRYDWMAGAFRDGLHVPQYNGVPTDRTGVWIGDGAVAIDSLNGYFYYRNGGTWIKVATFADIAANFPTWQQTLTKGSTLVGNNLVINNDDFHIRTVGVGDEWKSIYKVSDAATDSSYIGVRRGANPLAEVSSTIAGTTYKLTAGLLALDFLAQRNSTQDFSIMEGFADSLRITVNNDATDYVTEMAFSADSIKIRPNLGQINIDTLRTWSAVADTTFKKPMTWDTRNGRWEYASNWFGSGGGGGTPGGATTQVQFNDAGAFNGDAGLVYNKTTDVLTAGALVSQTYTDGTSIRCDGSEVFNTNALQLNIGNGGGFTSAVIASGASATLQIGGSTSAFPALVRSSANLQVKLADGSAFTNLEVLDDPYDATGWNGNIAVPTKNAIRDMKEAVTALFGTGTYTPTLTNTTNLDASTAHVFQYSYITDPTSGLTVVTVSGYVEIDPTNTLTLTQLTMTVPIATLFGNIQECGGTAASSTIASASAAIRAGAASDKVVMQWNCVDTSNHSMYLTFTYKVTPP